MTVSHSDQSKAVLRAKLQPILKDVKDQKEILRSVERVFNQTYAAFPFGSTNIDYSEGHPRASNRCYTDTSVTFIQEIKNSIDNISDDKYPILKDKLPNCSVNNKDLLCLYARALLSELYGCGNCHEQSAVLFFSYLKNGIVGEGIHRVCIPGIQKKHNVEDDHSFVLFCDPNNVNDMNKWVNCVIADTWESTLKLSVVGNKPLTVEDATSGYFKEGSLGDIEAISFTECLTADDLTILQTLLETLKKILTVELLFDCDSMEIEWQAQDEYQKIQDKIDQEICLIKWLILYAKTNHVSVSDKGYFGSNQKVDPPITVTENVPKPTTSLTSTPFEF